MQYAVFFYACLSLSLTLSHSSMASSVANADLQLTLPKAGSFEPEITGHFYEQALRLALEKTRREHEQIHFDYYKVSVNRERARLLVKQGIIDIIWSSSNKKRENQLMPVKFNLIRGINEYRLLLIRADDQPRFDQVNALSDLQKFKIGSGLHWSDADIYRFNGLPLVTSDAYDSMFRMLEARRFDYMARSIQEVINEQEQYPALRLSIEKNLMIHYQQPIYFFVNNN